MTQLPTQLLTLALTCGLALACSPSEDGQTPAGIPLDGADLTAIGVEWFDTSDSFPVLLDSSTAILLGPDAALVSDPMNAIVHRIESASHAVGTPTAAIRGIGGRGDGPGEFRSIGGLALIGDTLFVSDPARGGAHLLMLPDLEFRTLRIWEAESRTEGIFHYVVNPPAGIWPLAGGNAIARPNSMAVSAPQPRPGLIRDELEIPFPLLRPDDPSWTVPAHLTELHESVVVTEGGRTAAIVPPTSPTELFAAFPTGAGFVKLTQSHGTARRPARIQVTWFDASGEEAAVREYVEEASAITEDEKAMLAEEALVMPAGALPPVRVREILADHDLLPNHRLPVTRIRGDQSGRLWLELAEPGDARRWIILSDDGQVAGQVTAPEGTEFLGALGSTAVFGRPVGVGEFVPSFGRVRF